MGRKDIRWKQRFDNLERAYEIFWRILDIKAPNEAEKMGLIQAFEIVFELSWKTMKDYLFEQGFNEKSPRGVLKQAFQNEIIADGHHWIEALENRNETTHTYDDDMAEKIDGKIREIYAPMIRDMYVYLKKEYHHE
ncbi:Nucleotidyltransferase [Candidatus Desulfarcum epimagneticum]|uniref:Nucleotidyltransferase n=1 Tax=uncultured Desulfobacteraceae bacterium TaxID=218296 RepID=A0A484HHA7_9BACT|nr:Nucleotidyltransferase [uncultured Desulfobacteraceae bacterium]